MGASGGQAADVTFVGGGGLCGRHNGVSTDGGPVTGYTEGVCSHTRCVGLRERQYDGDSLRGKMA